MIRRDSLNRWHKLTKLLVLSFVLCVSMQTMTTFAQESGDILDENKQIISIEVIEDSRAPDSQGGGGQSSNNSLKGDSDKRLPQLGEVSPLFLTLFSIIPFTLFWILVVVKKRRKQS